VTERWVLNASPLLVLANTGYEVLLRQLADTVVIPSAVAIEIMAGPHNDRARLQVASGNWPIVDSPHALINYWPGISEVARHPSYPTPRSIRAGLQFLTMALPVAVHGRSMFRLRALLASFFRRNAAD
jgi:hypothetical protein